MPAVDSGRHCQSITLTPGSKLPDWLPASQQPVKLSGYISHWQAVQYGKQSAYDLCQHLLKFYTGEPLGFFFGAPDINGRFFYNEDMSGFNFDKVAAELGLILRKLLDTQTMTTPPAIFIGGTHLQQYLPGFETENPRIPVPHEQPRNGLWVGNKTRVAIHQDLPLNIACCVAGRRRFTLFPPDQMPNLYIGPLEHTPSGQPVSLVDLHNINEQRFPRFRQAMAHMQIAELEPGDALFIPSMWWHEVEALAPFNLLVNYWWRTTPDYMDAPINALQHALQHALLSIAGLPPEEKQIWQDMFNHYIFNQHGTQHDHIPEEAKGILGLPGEENARRLRSLLLQALNR